MHFSWEKFAPIQRMLLFNAFVLVQAFSMHCTVCACNVRLSSWLPYTPLEYFILSIILALYHPGQQILAVAINHEYWSIACLVWVNNHWNCWSENNDTTKPIQQNSFLTRAKALVKLIFLHLQLKQWSPTTTWTHHGINKPDQIYNIWWPKIQNNGKVQDRRGLKGWLQRVFGCRSHLCKHMQIMQEYHH